MQIQLVIIATIMVVGPTMIDCKDVEAIKTLKPKGIFSDYKTNLFITYAQNCKIKFHDDI